MVRKKDGMGAAVRFHAGHHWILTYDFMTRNVQAILFLAYICKLVRFNNNIIWKRAVRSTLPVFYVLCSTLVVTIAFDGIRTEPLSDVKGLI